MEGTKGQNNRIRILYTSDLHGKVYPYSYADGAEKMYGLARLKTLADSLRDENTILIDNGDVLEGSPLTFYHFKNQKEEVCPATTAMRRMNYDFVNIGNHDFNFGTDALFLHLKETGAECITTNVTYRGRAFGKPYVIRELAGRRIAFFGIMTQYVPHWEQPENIRDVVFSDAFETAQKTVRLIKETEKTDYIVCVYHGGLERDLKTGEAIEVQTGENEGYRILKEIDGIDVLLTGHQHRTICETLFGTLCMQPGADGAYLACVEIDMEEGAITGKLLPANTAPEEAMMRALQPVEDTVQAWLDTPLGTSKVDLVIRDGFDARLNKSQVATFLNMVQSETTGAELSASAIFLGATGFSEHITMRQLVATYVFPNTLVVKRVTGKALRAFLERAAQFFDVKDGKVVISASHDFPTPQHFNYDMVDGVTYTIKAGNPVGERVILLQKDGKDVRDDDVFTLAVNNYRAAGGGEYTMIAEAETVREDLTSMVDLIADYIMRNPVIDFTPVNNIRVIP